jgi:polyhydroxyalkanoate synthesis regulator phasin
MTENEPLAKRFQNVWHKTVGNYATDEKGTQSLLQRLVDFGQLSAEEAKKVLVEAQKKIDDNKRELDRRVDESIKGAVERLTEGSSAREVKKLEERLSDLEKKLAELESN